MKYQLIVFEGNDGVGKTTIANELSKRLSLYGAKVFSSPGKERDGSLGQFVYQYHDGQKTVITETIPPLSLQMLHVAAHISNYTNVIIPWIKRGNVAILDRWWWSTVAYGKAFGIDDVNLYSVIRPELSIINDAIKEIVIVYISRDYESKHTREFDGELLTSYKGLVNQSEFPVIEVRNEGQRISLLVDGIIKELQD